MARKRIEAHDPATADEPVEEAVLTADPSQGLGMLMLQCREIIVSPIRPILREHQLTDQQWRILRVQMTEPSSSPAELARRTVISLPSLSRIIKDLQVRGLVESIQTDDSKRPRVSITPAGRSLVEKLYPRIYKKQEGIRNVFGEENTKQLAALLRQLVDIAP